MTLSSEASVQVHNKDEEEPTTHKAQYDAGRLATTSGQVPKHFDAPAPDPELKPNGQHKDYWVLSMAERAKGFVRPVYDSYVHVGPPGPLYPLRDLTEEEKEKFRDEGYVKFEEYPEERRPTLGHYWTQERLNRAQKACGSVTSMSRSLAETYAREPRFYGSTFCVTCSKHFPVGEKGEFIWAGTNERVGT